MIIFIIKEDNKLWGVKLDMSTFRPPCLVFIVMDDDSALVMRESGRTENFD
ncbi:MAG: hypothetical protein Q6367_001195 [Candidatus Freyarchaeota archaeon]